MTPLRHAAVQVDDGPRCSCGSDGCIVTGEGVWTPSRRVTPIEWAEAFETFTADNVAGWVAVILREHEGHGGQVVAEHDGDGSLYWWLSPRDAG